MVMKTVPVEKGCEGKGVVRTTSFGEQLKHKVIHTINCTSGSRDEEVIRVLLILPLRQHRMVELLSITSDHAVCWTEQSW